MKPVYQTILADPTRGDGCDAEGRPGNCYQAAIASALELPLDDVPHFAAFGTGWLKQSEKWFRNRGIVRAFYCEPLCYPLWVASGTLIEGIPVTGIIAVLGAGLSPRGEFWHAVVLSPESGEMIHDPHPSGRGIEVAEVEVLFATNKST